MGRGLGSAPVNLPPRDRESFTELPLSNKERNFRQKLWHGIKSGVLTVVHVAPDGEHSQFHELQFPPCVCPASDESPNREGEQEQR